jgi:choline dehydrogenase-like flavoprotein
MIRDARGIEDGATVACDVAIVGAGAAGITLALALAGSRNRVCLLESGGLEYESEVQALYQGLNIGRPYFDLDVSRLRFLGGSTNHWAGRCRPLDALDFEPRPWVPLSGWPIGSADLEPYYREAQGVCGLGPFDYEPGRWLGEGEETLPADPAKLVSRVWQYSPPLAFGDAYRDQLEAADDVDLILHASLVEIVAGEGGREVVALEHRTLDGRRLTVEPRIAVLAMGGLETPRLMLASSRVINVGIGNQHDLVGRCFMEHPHANSARALVVAPEVLSFYTRGLARAAGEGVEVVGCLSLAPEQQQAQEALNFDCLFTIDDVGDSGFAALRRIFGAAGRGEWPDDLSADLWQAISDIGDTTAGVMGRLGIREYRPETSAFRMWTSAEQAPNPDSRVRLADEVDALGLPRIALDWRLSELDKRSYRIAHETIAAELGRTEQGRLQIAEWVSAGLDTWSPDLEGGHHHMGTTRMSDDPRQGVVDADCRVHGTANLYVAGSSVFATSGSANPTLSIAALTLRLADHLKTISS